jgi:hypothetical protein
MEHNNFATGIAHFDYQDLHNPERLKALADVFYASIKPMIFNSINNL